MQMTRPPCPETSSTCFELKEIIMNTKQLIAAAAIALVGSTTVFAQSADELQRFGSDQTSTLTRAEVRTELLRARAAGEAPVVSDLIWASSPVAASTRVTDPTRAQVRAEVVKGLADGSLAQPTDVTAGATASSVRSREEVRAEARASIRSAQAAPVQAGH
jgi:hypothetical protein